MVIHQDESECQSSRKIDIYSRKKNENVFGQQKIYENKRKISKKRTFASEFPVILDLRNDSVINADSNFLVQ